MLPEWGRGSALQVQRARVTHGALGGFRQARRAAKASRGGGIPLTKVLEENLSPRKTEISPWGSKSWSFSADS